MTSIKTKQWPIGLAAVLMCGVSSSNPVEQKSSIHASNLEQTAVQQSPAETTRFDRQQWNLSEQQWQRYQSLMQGIRGSISPNSLSPIEVLGLHAKTEEERQLYAEQWAKMMHQDVERTLAFQKAYDQAWDKLYPNEKVIDIAKLLGSKSTNQALQSGDRVLLFTQLGPCPACNQAIKRLKFKITKPELQWDIYFVDSKSPKDDDKIVTWAKQQNFDADLLKKKRITFNHDQGTLARLTRQPVNAVPKAYIIRDNAYQPLKLGAL